MVKYKNSLVKFKKCLVQYFKYAQSNLLHHEPMKKSERSKLHVIFNDIQDRT